MISLDDEVARLRTVPFFSAIDNGKLKLLAYASEKLGFEDGDVVIHQGSMDSDVYFILEGAADVLTSTNDGPIVVAHLPQHALFGEISALCDIPRTATIRASGRLVVLKISQNHLLELIRGSPAVALHIIRVLALRLVDTTRDLTAARSQK
jgi:CRP-like cAMP-binding protein